ncbi:NADP-dependent oxidoreductase [Exilibacterium tricleocarpae]|uniref:NADP-dependent oxidoreductase n=1 Tax=Exilibacterium tricleocarpae TaxID=2591008 RepID=A0A545U3M9_9GAMM|nr:NADP-dependent oxidoreductase [Exilibacterium tricleocarpae]TQV84013.1 NADP-dependent oxidoreductase [Exilibacterium tricleocarpae]
MSNYKNRRIVLARRPKGEVADEDLRLESVDMKPLDDGEILIKVLWLSLDPYMRPRMNDLKSYMDPIAIDAVIVGESVGQVVESRSGKYAVGDYVTSYSGWQEYYVAPETEAMMYKVDPRGLPLSVFLGAAGMPARTAYLGLTRVGKPEAGETVVVSAASGAVGSVVGQIAKTLGCRVVGIAGGEKKCSYVTGELGFDACVDYKAGNLDADLAAACPAGIDVYFENVGGAVTRAVAPLLNKGSRVPVCGYISAYNEQDITAVETPFHILGALPEPPEHRFFVVTEWQDEHEEVTRQLVDWVKDGKIKYSESVADGLDNAVDAFRGMLQGKNFGKQLVKIAEQ